MLKTKLIDEWHLVYKYLVVHIAWICSALTAVLGYSNMMPNWVTQVIIVLLTVASFIKFESGVKTE